MTLLNDILDFTKLESKKLNLHIQPTGLTELVKNVVNLFEIKARNKGIVFLVSLDENLPSVVFVDSLRLRQVLINILDNAFKFTHQGKVNLVVQLEKPSSDMVENESKIRFDISDTGIGIPNEEIQSVFSSFQQIDSDNTRVYSGVGLGLTISQGILKMMGSTIKMESQISTGSRFWFNLILKSSPASQLRENSDVEDEDVFDKHMGFSFPMNILVVEDNELIQKILKRCLNKMGYNPTISGNGALALDEMKVREYDLVFMDIQMPVMDGVEATQKIRSKYGDSKPVIVALTADALGNDKQVYLDAGMDDYISKPCNPNQIKGCLRNWYMRRNLV